MQWGSQTQTSEVWRQGFICSGSSGGTVACRDRAVLNLLGEDRLSQRDETEGLVNHGRGVLGIGFYFLIGAH